MGALVLHFKNLLWNFAVVLEHHVCQVNLAVVSSGDGFIGVHGRADDGRPKQQASYVASCHAFFCIGFLFESLCV